MAKIDFSDYLFRCHALSRIMTKAKTGNGLSVGAKTYLQELHTEEFFGRKKEITSKFLDKGIQVEEQSITLYSEVTGQLLMKNEKRFKNLFLSGEPDNVQGKVRDFKSSWDIHSFLMYDDSKISKANFYQVQGYMDLTGLKEAEVIYCLCDTPKLLIDDEKWRVSRKYGNIELPAETEKEIERSMIYTDVPDEFKVRVFDIKKDPEVIKEIYNRIVLARNYLNKLSNELAERL